MTNSARANGRPLTINGAETVIARPADGNTSDSSDDSMRAAARRHVALVEGSTPHISAETRDLLRNRLRMAAILFFIGFFVFLVRWFFIWNEWIAAEHRPLFFTHAR